MSETLNTSAVAGLDEIVTCIIAGGSLAREDARELMKATSSDEVSSLAAAGGRVRARFRGRRASLCGLVNAKSGACSEDCRFCAQSARYDSGADVFPQLDEDEMVRKASELVGTGVDHVGIVMSGKSPSSAELAVVCRAAERILKETGLNVHCSLGLLTYDQATTLRNAGIEQYNHNLETSESYFPKVCGTHAWRDRYATALAVKKAGMELCCGGILGMGESDEDRMDLAYSLQELAPESVPINLLNPRPGTPLGNANVLSALDAVKFIALFRLVLPRGVIKLAGGREVVLRSMQATALMAGADGMIIGGYLTTSGQSIETDIQMLKDCGFEVGIA